MVRAKHGSQHQSATKVISHNCMAAQLLADSLSFQTCSSVV